MIDWIKRRTLFQFFFSILQNSWFAGFIQGEIWTGKSKYLCVPGLNCYSCPAAWGSCPIGSLQTVIGTAKYQFSFYVTGTLALFGVIFGRFICGWFCPFGFVQELLHRIPTSKHIINGRYLKYIKYLVLIVFVIIMPIFVVNIAGMGDPWFCKLLCPAGTLEGAVPLLAVNKPLRQAAGLLFDWKITILIVILLLAVFIYLPFCRFLCPLGAIYGLFNRISFVSLNVNKQKCIDCGLCAQVCGMGVDPCKNSASPECIRCGKCVSSCRQQAISLNIMPGEACMPVNGNNVN